MKTGFYPVPTFLEKSEKVLKAKFFGKKEYLVKPKMAINMWYIVKFMSGTAPFISNFSGPTTHLRYLEPYYIYKPVPFPRTAQNVKAINEQKSYFQRTAVDLKNSIKFEKTKNNNKLRAFLPSSMIPTTILNFWQKPYLIIPREDVDHFRKHIAWAALTSKVVRDNKSEYGVTSIALANCLFEETPFLLDSMFYDGPDHNPIHRSILDDAIPMETLLAKASTALWLDCTGKRGKLSIIFRSRSACNMVGHECVQKAIILPSSKIKDIRELNHEDDKSLETVKELIYTGSTVEGGFVETIMDEIGLSPVYSKFYGEIFSDALWGKSHLVEIDDCTDIIKRGTIPVYPWRMRNALNNLVTLTRVATYDVPEWKPFSGRSELGKESIYKLNKCDKSGKCGYCWE